MKAYQAFDIADELTDVTCDLRVNPAFQCEAFLNVSGAEQNAFFITLKDDPIAAVIEIERIAERYADEHIDGKVGRDLWDALTTLRETWL